jgi:signal transduction histidine kinase
MAENPALRILSVDDNEAIRYSVTRYLREGGYQVIEARNGVEALDLAQQNPDLITLDINLPDINGYEICRRLKDHAATRDIPVLHISASCVDAGDRVRGLEGGADGYLAEPVDRLELLATVKALLRMRQAQREARSQAAEAEKARQEMEHINERLEFRVRQRTAELERERLDVRNLSSQLLLAQDEERRRISRELHDSTGQLLVALTMNLERLKSELTKPNPGAEAVINDTRSLVDEMSRQLRTMSYLLHPPLLDEAGLASAVRWYVEGFATRSSVQVSLELPSELGRLPQQMEITIFRLIQESLTNIHRHSGSKTALIRLTRDAQSVRLEIADQGSGFTPHAPASEPSDRRSRPGVGILGMKERVRRFGGTLEFLSGSNGTTVQARLPIGAGERDYARTGS